MRFSLFLTLPPIKFRIELLPKIRYRFGNFFLLTKTLPNLVPLIQSEVVVVVDRDLPDSLTLRYTPTPILSSRFDLYRFRISDKNNTTKEKLVSDIDTKVTFSDLIPGRLYNVTMWTVSDNVESRPLFRQDRLCKYLLLTIFEILI